VLCGRRSMRQCADAWGSASACAAPLREMRRCIRVRLRNTAPYGGAAQATGSPTDFPKTKESYVNWGDLDDDGSQTGRFRGVPLEPFTKPLVESK
jgi:hypothetical protein